MHRVTVAIMIGALALTGCGGSASNPSTPTTTPTTTPARPTPTPAPTPAGLTCTVPEYKDADGCSIWTNAKGHPVFLGEVIEAIGTLKRERPDLFTYDPAHPNLQPLINNKNVYLAGLVKVLARDYGLCARENVWGVPRDEISVKNSNDWSEQYDVMTGAGYVVWSYTVTCRPPTF